MKVKEVTRPEEIRRWIMNQVLIPAPVKLIRTKLRHDNGNNHYLYIINFGNNTIFYLDNATDYSGSGMHTKKEMDKTFEHLSTTLNAKIEEYEMPFELYWQLKLITNAHAEGNGEQSPKAASI